MNKRGISHVEMILSFVLFAGAIAFALYFFTPSDSNRLIDSSLTYSFREIDQNTSIGLSVFSVTINQSLILNNTISINISGVNESWISKVQMRDGALLSSYRQGDFIHINDPVGWIGTDFITVSFSGEFIGGSPLSGDFSDDSFELGGSTSEKIVSELRFLDLNKSYSQDYIGLKEEFNLPYRVNFGFSLVFNDGKIIETNRLVPDGLEVFSREKRVKVIRDQTGEIEFADLTVLVW
jgi:hypothetical protein